ncbi:MAG: hypothetical protein R3C45_02350 [Phycisphaerales bacterium]
MPRLYACGEVLGGYDMAWVVMERLTHGPLGSAWRGAEFSLLIEAVGRFYQATVDIPIHTKHVHRDWGAIHDHARASVRDHALPEAQRWNKAAGKIAQAVQGMGQHLQHADRWSIGVTATCTWVTP